MQMKLSVILLVTTLTTLSGCSTIPPEAILAARQVETNLEVMEANSRVILDEWHALSVDYWTDKIARDGADIILEKARERGIEFDLNEDYQDLTAQLIREYREKFLNPLDREYAEYRQQIWADYALTKDAVRRIGDLLEANVKLQQQQKALIDGVAPNVADATPRIMQFMEGMNLIWESMAGQPAGATTFTDVP